MNEQLAYTIEVFANGLMAGVLCDHSDGRGHGVAGGVRAAVRVPASGWARADHPVYGDHRSGVFP